MIMLRTGCILLALFLAVPVPGPAQSLGEIAKREEEKKEKKKKAGKPPSTAKVYTEEDLKKARESDAGNLTILPDTGATESSSSSGSSGEQPAGRLGGENSVESTARPRDERGWRALASQRRQAVKVAESRVQMLEGQIAALRNDMSPTNVMDPNRLQTQGRELEEAQTNLDAARQELDQARQALANLEDDARRAGAMPGWVR
jgi:predicted  nucleic acid-binding Zn-ribbon protein